MDRAIYTPGSKSGRPLAVLRSLVAPSSAVVADEDAFREMIMASVSGLLALLRIDADQLLLVWTPWTVDADGIAEEAF